MAALLLFVLLATAMGLSAACAEADCFATIMTMSPCLNFITDRADGVPVECCLQLRHVVQERPRCLCTLLDGEVARRLGISINETRALALPGMCHVPTPPPSECQRSAALPPASSGIAPGGGANSHKDNASSDGSHFKWSLTLFLCCIVYSALTIFL